MRTSFKMQWLAGGLVVTIIFFFIYSNHLRDQMDESTSYANRALRKSGPEPNVLPESIRDDGALMKEDHKLDSKAPLIFIGGVPRSGTTLMRAMLDAHPDVRCGEETRVIPRILGLRAQWHRSEKEWNRLQQAGVTNEVLNRAISSFILEVISGHGEPAPRLCNKDPFTLKSVSYLAEIFPNAKYIFMIRDGRATVHSIITRKVTITGFDLTSYRQSLEKWNHAISVMDEQCEAVNEKCLRVHYEELVLHPEPQMRRILKFLGLPWNDLVLHHEELIGKDIKLSNVERSSDQVVKPVNVDALSKWVGAIPDDVIADMADIAPMLEALGYDPHANPPIYGTPDKIVQKKMEELQKNADIWYQKAIEVVENASRVEKPVMGDPRKIGGIVW